MVIQRLLATAFCALLLASCSSEESSPDTVADSTSKGAVATQEAPNPETESLIEAPEPSSDTITLKYKKGEVYKYRVKQVATSTQDSIKSATTSYHTYTKRVKDVLKDGSFEVAMAFNAINLHVDVRNSSDGTVLQQNEFDSQNKEHLADPKNSQFAYIIGEDVSVFYSPKAEVTNIVGVAPIVKKIIGSTPGTAEIPAQQLQQMSLQLEQQIQSVMYGAFAVQEFIPYPTNSVVKEGAWTNSRSSPMGAMFSAKSTTTYNIESVEVVNGQRIATIKAVLRGEIKPQPIPAQAGAKLEIVDAKIGGTSEAVMNLDNGTTVSKSNRIIVSITADVTETATGKTRRLNQSQESLIEVKLLP